MIKIIITTFLMVFIAELGDKTQLATMLLVAKNKTIWPVFIGSSLALVCSSFLGVFAGDFLAKNVPPNVIQNASAIACIAIGLLLLLGKI